MMVKRNRKDYMKEYRKKNRNKILEQAKVYSKKYYYNNHKLILTKMKNWRDNNPGYGTDSQRSYYKRNKQKYISRINTNLWVNGKKRGDYIFKKIEGPEKICKKCNALESLQIHHEIYPTRKKDIIESIKNKQIYYLCKRCHGEIHRK